MSKWKIFMTTLTGLTVSFIFVNLLGVGLASGVATTPAWFDAYNISSGALLLAGYGGLGGIGQFCTVIIAMGLGSNQIPSTYAAALDFQVLGCTWKAVPRYLWATVAAIIYFVCAVAGRDHLFLIFQNFLALMGYWLAIFITVVLEEHNIFRLDGVGGQGEATRRHRSADRLPGRMGGADCGHVPGLVDGTHSEEVGR
jgi:purine-cytosine permease-like protein